MVFKIVQSNGVVRQNILVFIQQLKTSVQSSSVWQPIKVNIKGSVCFDIDDRLVVVVVVVVFWGDSVFIVSGCSVVGDVASTAEGVVNSVACVASVVVDAYNDTVACVSIG